MVSKNDFIWYDLWYFTLDSDTAHFLACVGNAPIHSFDAINGKLKCSYFIPSRVNQMTPMYSTSYNTMGNKYSMLLSHKIESIVVVKERFMFLRPYAQDQIILSLIHVATSKTHRLESYLVLRSTQSLAICFLLEVTIKPLESMMRDRNQFYHVTLATMEESPI